MSKKIILSILVFLTFSFSFVNLAYAITPTPTSTSTPTPAPETWYNQSFKSWFSKVNDSPSTEIFGERYTAAQVQWVIYGLFYFLVNGGGENTNALSCIMKKDIMECIDAIKDLISFATIPSQPQGMVAFLLQDRPLSGITYVKETARNWHLIPQAQAQEAGFGFSALDPMLYLWRASRNIAYVFFVIIIVAMAFMIMFRVKISPQTVITVQSALPKIAIALILITFSYAIAGFMIDLMYVVIGFVSALLSASGLTASPAAMFDFMTKGPVILGQGTGILGILLYYGTRFMIALFYTLFGGAGGGLATLFGAFIITLFISIVLVVVFFIAAIKIMWLLIKTFANIILSVVFAPFQIALGAITSATGFGAWLKSFASNLAVFPLVGILSSLAFIFLTQALQISLGPDAYSLLVTDDVLGVFKNLPPTPQQTYFPPLLGSGKGLYGLSLVGVSLSIMLILPKVAELIQGFMSGKPFAYGAAIGEAVGPVTGAAAAAGSFGVKYGAGTAATTLERLGAPSREGGEPLSRTLQNLAAAIRATSGVKK